MLYRLKITAWGLILVATVAMGCVAWWLLEREADRVRHITSGAVANRAAIVAKDLDLLASEIKLSLAEGLLTGRETPDPKLALSQLVADNPYAHSGFAYRSRDGVTTWHGDRNDLPTPSHMSKSGKLPWAEAAVSETADEPDATSPAPPREESVAAPAEAAEPEAPRSRAQLRGKAETAAEQRSSIYRMNVATRSKLNRSQLPKADAAADMDGFQAETSNVDAGVDTFEPRRGLGRSSARESASELEAASEQPSASQSPPPNPLRHGWAEIHTGTTRQWLHWSNLPQSENIIGVWLNRDAVVAELAKALARNQNADTKLQLFDASGHRVAGEPGREPAEDSPATRLPLGASLPGWSLHVQSTMAANPFGEPFRILGGLTVLGLSIAILLGGSVLLWQANRDALDAARKTTFVANVSHELKTPLTSIRMFAEMLYDGRVTAAERRQQYLATMLDEAERLSRLVDNVLDFSRLERGKRTFDTEITDLGRLVADTVDRQRERLGEAGLTPELQMQDTPVLAAIAPDAVSRILLNLLDNAAKYATSGTRVQVRLHSTADAARVEVADWGPGIPRSERAAVFRAFHRADSRLTNGQPGTGLGLSIAARLAAGMGGKLTLAPNEPHGCRFTLSLPHDHSHA